MTGLAKKSFVLLIFLTNGGTVTAKIQNILSNLSNIKQFRQSELAEQLHWE